MKTNLLFNPFTRVAGWRAFGTGIAVMALTALTGWKTGVIFDGALDIFTAPHTLARAFIAQGVAFASLFLCLWLAGAIFSRTKYRIVDVAGTVALGRSPLLALTLLSLLPIVPDGLFDMPRILIFWLLAVGAGIWMIALLYNGYTVCFNLRGTRGVLSFIGGLAAAETVSKLALVALLLSGVTGTAKAADVKPAQIPAGQTVNQTAAIIIEAFNNGNYADASSYFDERMKEGLSPVKLTALWSGLQIQLGKFESADTEVEATAHDEYRILLVPCKFARGEVKLQLAFNAQGYISGLYIK